MTKKWHTTHTQPHKPLFMGWIVHGMTTTMMTDDWEPNEKKAYIFSHFFFILLTNSLGTN